MFKYLKDYVELRTKVASVFPFLYVLTIYLYAFAKYEFNPQIAIMFFISMVSLDMATTVLNHLAGMKKETDISKYDQHLLDLMTKHRISDTFNILILLILLVTGIGLGLVIAMITNLFVVIIGAVCMLVAVTYSFGPLPTKNTPLGEILSGVTMGALIPLAFLFAQDSSIFILNISFNTILINLHMVFIWIAILAVPTLVIANIMLANNTCDIDKDANNQRITLPIAIGAKSSKLLFINLYVISYCIIICLIVGGLLPKLCLIGLVTLPIVLFTSYKFVNNPQKAVTFKYAVINLQLVLLSVIVPLLINLYI